MSDGTLTADSLGALNTRLSELVESDGHRGVSVALQIVKRVKDVTDLEPEGEWASFAVGLLGPGLINIIGSVTSIEPLPSSNAYEPLDVASAAVLSSLPALHEVLLLSSSESVSTVVRASKELEKQLEEAREAVSSKSDALSRLLSLTADDTLASSYSNQALDERKRADRWRVAAVTLLSSAVALAAVTVFVSLSAGLDIEHLIGRVGLSGALAALGGYLQHQASLHRNRESRARDAELKLRTIGPYSASLPAEEAARVRTELGLSIFADDERHAQATTRESSAP